MSDDDIVPFWHLPDVEPPSPDDDLAIVIFRRFVSATHGHPLTLGELRKIIKDWDHK